MPRAKRYIPLVMALCLCLVLAAAAYTYQGWAASRQSVVAYSNLTPIEGAPPLIALEPAPAVVATAPPPPAPAPVSQPEPTPAPKPPVTRAPAQRVDLSSRNSSRDNRAATEQDLNSYVLNIVKTYPVGRYPYLLNTDYANYNGVTQNIFYQGTLLLRAHPSGSKASHCSGITFEVFYKAMQQRNKEAGLSPSDFNGMSFAEMKDFMLTWYVANGPKPHSNIAVAVEKYGLGKQIHRLEQAKAGDFIDISRKNSTGHTAVLINWVWKDGKIIGVKYWSSQGSTNGINYNQEYFNVRNANGVPYGNVLIDQVYIARVGPIREYKR